MSEPSSRTASVEACSQKPRPHRIPSVVSLRGRVISLTHSGDTIRPSKNALQTRLTSAVVV